MQTLTQYNKPMLIISKQLTKWTTSFFSCIPFTFTLDLINNVKWKEAMQRMHAQYPPSGCVLPAALSIRPLQQFSSTQAYS